MSFGPPPVTALAATDVDATTLIPASKASARNEIDAQSLLRGIMAVSTGSLTTTSTQGLVQAEPAATGAPSASLTITRPAHTALTASTEYSDVVVSAATQQFATGALTLNRAVQLLAPTYGFVGSSTLSTAVNLWVAKPVQGTNATLTRTYAIDAEDSRIQGILTVKQAAGTAGTDEVQISHNGTQGRIECKDGVLQLADYCFVLPSYQPFLAVDSTGTRGIGSVGSNTTNLFVDSAAHFGFSTDGALGVSSGGQIGFGSASPINAGALDTALVRTAANVMGMAAGDWFQNTAGGIGLASAFTRADATLTATALSRAVIAGRSYRITGCLQVSNTTAAEGVQIDFAGGDATATTFFMGATAQGSVVAGTATSATLAGVINYTTVTGTDLIHLNGYLKVNAAGTFILRAAENSTALGTLTVGAGSWINLEDIPTA